MTEIERRLRVSEQVIKFITVRMDEEEKRLAKIKQHRDTHVKRSAIPVPQTAFPRRRRATEARVRARAGHPRNCGAARGRHREAPHRVPAKRAV